MRVSLCVLFAVCTVCSAAKLSQKDKTVFYNAGAFEPSPEETALADRLKRQELAPLWGKISKQPIDVTGRRPTLADHIDAKVSLALHRLQTPTKKQQEDMSKFDREFPSLTETSFVVSPSTMGDVGLGNFSSSILHSRMSAQNLSDWEFGRTRLSRAFVHEKDNLYDTHELVIENISIYASEALPLIAKLDELHENMRRLSGKSRKSRDDQRKLKEFENELALLQERVQGDIEMLYAYATSFPVENSVPLRKPTDRRAVHSPLITVGTLNAQYLMENYEMTRGTWATDLDLVRHTFAVAKMLEQLDSDVIVVNEVGSFGALELARAFMGETGKDYRVYTLPTKMANSVASAIMTKIDIVHPLMTLKLEEMIDLRCTVARLEVWLDAAGSERQPVEVYGTHLKSNLRSSEFASHHRRNDALRIKNALEEGMALEPRTVFVIAGDINEEDPQARTERLLEASPVFDALRVNGNLASCYDRLPKVPHTHTRRILDYILAPAEILAGDAQHADDMGTLFIPRDAFIGKPGDHSGVCAKLLLPSTSKALYGAESPFRHSACEDDQAASGSKTTSKCRRSLW